LFELRRWDLIRSSMILSIGSFVLDCGKEVSLWGLIVRSFLSSFGFVFYQSLHRFSLFLFFSFSLALSLSFTMSRVTSRTVSGTKPQMGEIPQKKQKQNHDAAILLFFIVLGIAIVGFFQVRVVARIATGIVIILIIYRYLIINKNRSGPKSGELTLARAIELAKKCGVLRRAPSLASGYDDDDQGPTYPGDGDDDDGNHLGITKWYRKNSALVSRIFKSPKDIQNQSGAENTQLYKDVTNEVLGYVRRTTHSPNEDPFCVDLRNYFAIKFLLVGHDLQSKEPTETMAGDFFQSMGLSFLYLMESIEENETITRLGMTYDVAKTVCEISTIRTSNTVQTNLVKVWICNCDQLTLHIESKVKQNLSSKGLRVFFQMRKWMAESEPSPTEWFNVSPRTMMDEVVRVTMIYLLAQ